MRQPAPDAATHNAWRGEQRTNTRAATEAVQQYAAERAIDDPVKLARAARIIRTALARGRLTTADILPPQLADAARGGDAA